MTGTDPKGEGRTELEAFIVRSGTVNLLPRVDGSNQFVIKNRHFCGLPKQRDYKVFPQRKVDFSIFVASVRSLESAE